MRRMVKYAVAALALVAATSGQAQAQTVRLTAVMSGANETPGVLTGATGTAEVFVNLATQTVSYEIEIFNLPSGTTAGHFHVGGPGLAGPIVVDLAPQVNVFNLPSGAVGGHFHVGGAGVGGPVVVDLAPPANVSNDFTLSGTVAPSSLRVRADQGIRTWEDFIQSLIGGQVYVNIHSAVNPGGETRGQLTVTP